MEPITVQNIDELKKIEKDLDSKQPLSFLCPVCSRPVLRKLYRLQYTNYNLLCKSCSYKDKVKGDRLKQQQEKRKQTCLEKYGVENPGSAKQFIEKRQQTCKERYGETSFSKTDEFQKKVKKTWKDKTSEEIQEIVDKNKQTCLERYGNENVNLLPEFREKRKQTCLDRYGVDCGLRQTDKIKETLLKKYNVDNISKVDEIKEKKKQTCLERYGAQYSILSSKVRTKIQKTLLSRYGVDSFSKTRDFKEKVQKTWLNKSRSELHKINQTRKNTLFNKYGVFNFSQTPEFSKKRYHRYLYQDLFFDSKPELAFWIYHKDHNINIEKEPSTFTYNYKNREYKYTPDFKVDNTLFELKGDQFLKDDGTWQNPFDSSLNEKYESKRQCALKNNIRILYSKDYQKYLDYVNQKYTSDFLDLFMVSLPFPFVDKIQNVNNNYDIIRYFHKSIYTASKANHPSPFEAWQDKNLVLKSALNRLQYVGNCKPSMVVRGFSVTRIAPKVSVFRPNLADRLIKTYLDESETIFDPFSGFSGRLLGTASCNKKYIGQDLNEEHVKESNEIIQFKELQNCTVVQQDLLTDSNKQFFNTSLFTCPPYSDKEFWTEDKSELTKTCDEWIDICLEKYKCDNYLFVVDETEKYKDNVVECLGTQGGLFKRKSELVVLINHQ